jgi:uncharacterized protein YozE (UPF0346 family)
MKISDFFRTMCVVLIGISLGLISYKKLKHQTEQKTMIETNSVLVKKFLLKYKKPSRIEVQSFIKDEKNRFKKDIQDIKQLKIFLDPHSNFYIEMQLFTDENDSKAPLVVQCRFLDLKSKNLIQEQSLNLF